jgi:hypothetical protein
VHNVLIHCSSCFYTRIGVEIFDVAAGCFLDLITLSRYHMFEACPPSIPDGNSQQAATDFFHYPATFVTQIRLAGHT